MKTSLLLLAAASLWSAEESTRTIEKSFPLSGTSRSVYVCGINGPLTVTANDSNEVRFSVHEKLAASSRDRLEEIKRETDFVIVQEGNAIRAGVKGPWSDRDCTQRNTENRNRERRRWDGNDTKVEHDITVSLPRDARIELGNVNGSIRVTGTTGPYSVHTVNGGITMTDVEGSGDVVTVNGTVQAVYKRNPTAESKYRTVNGKLDLYFQPSLNADFKMKTVNGKAYTDFEMVSIPTTSSMKEGSNGMRVIHRNGALGEMRAGSGGPKISMETVNGSILIHSVDKGRP